MRSVEYLVCFAPCIFRAIMAVRFHRQMGKMLTEEQRQDDVHRTHILAMMGFSFSALLAVTVVDGSLATDFSNTLYFLLVSFLAYFGALNVQGYKLYRWWDQLGMALIDTASLALLLSLAAGIHVGQGFSTLWKVSVSLMLMTWLPDFIYRFQKEWSFLSKE